MYFRFILSKSTSSSLVIVFIHSAFSLCFFFWLPYFSSKHWISFASSCWYILMSSPICSNNFLSLFWNVLFCLYCYTLCQYLFNLPSFARTFYFISLSCILYFSCDDFSFLFLIIPSYFFCFIILAYFCRFIICVSCRNSHPGFDFSFMIFVGIPIFLQINFAPA